MGGLECDHCGFEPVDPEVCPTCDGTGEEELKLGVDVTCADCGGSGEVYFDGMGNGACQNCGFPGSVHADEGNCYWSDEGWNEAAHCNDPKCEECAEAWARETWFDRLVFFAEVMD